MDLAPLGGLRVVELGTVVAGPFAASLLADLGADVIKQEPAGQGDVLRRVGPMREGVPVWWGVSSRNKRCVGIDLKSTDGVCHFRRLLENADVLVSNYRPGALERLGFGPQDLASLNPRLIHVSISGYGSPGPKSHLPGYGKIGEGMSGLVNLTGRPDEMPLFCGFSLGDASTGLFAAVGTVFALYARDHGDGKGSVVDIALYEALLRITEAQFVDALEIGQPPTRAGTNYPYGGGRGAPWPRVVTAKTMNGKWVAVYVADQDAARACSSVIGADGSAECWDEAVRAWSASRTAGEVRDTLGPFGLEVAPVLDGQSLASNAYVQARGDIVHVHHELLGELAVQAQVDPVMAVSACQFHWASLDDPAETDWRAPKLDAGGAYGSSSGALFEDLLIVEISDTPAASFAATLFADYGATVYVLEPADRGSGLRRLSPSLWTALGRNKRSVAIPPGHDDPLAAGLLRRADILFTDVPRRQWADHPWLSDLPTDSRRVAAVTIFPTGSDRPDLWPWSSHPALSAAASGVMAMTGWKDGPPVQPEAPLADYCAGGLAALRLAASLWRGTAQGLVVEEPAHRALARMMEWQCVAASVLGRPPLRVGNDFPLNMGIGSLCRSNDGKYIAVSAVGDEIVARLLYVIGGDALLNDPRFATPEARTTHAPEVYGQIIEWASRHSVDEIMRIAVANDIVMGIVCNAQDIREDPHVLARGNLIEIGGKELSVTLVAVAPRVGDWVRPIRSPGPLLGTGNAAAETLLHLVAAPV